MTNFFEDLIIGNNETKRTKDDKDYIKENWINCGD